MISRNWNAFNKSKKTSFNTKVNYSNNSTRYLSAKAEKLEIIKGGEGSFTKADLDAIDKKYKVGKYFEDLDN